eukprot:5039236-Amphidinium_carterae.1
MAMQQAMYGNARVPHTKKGDTSRCSLTVMWYFLNLVQTSTLCPGTKYLHCRHLSLCDDKQETTIRSQ